MSLWTGFNSLRLGTVSGLFLNTVIDLRGISEICERFPACNTDFDSASLLFA